MVEPKMNNLLSLIREKLESRPNHSYVSISGDLNDIQGELGDRIIRQGFDPNIPTLILSEVLFIYLYGPKFASIVEWFSGTLNSSSDNEDGALQQSCGIGLSRGKSYMFSLDPSSFSDPFGVMMIKNLQENNIFPKNEFLLSGRRSFEDVLCKHHWSIKCTFTLKEAFEVHVPSAEKDRINSLELIDEFEEWNLLSSHYYFTLAKLDK